MAGFLVTFTAFSKELFSLFLFIFLPIEKKLISIFFHFLFSFFLYYIAAEGEKWNSHLFSFSSEIRNFFFFFHLYFFQFKSFPLFKFLINQKPFSWFTSDFFILKLFLVLIFILNFNVFEIANFLREPELRASVKV